jgi:hypothetical protein
MRHIVGGSIPNVRVSELRSDNSAVTEHIRIFSNNLKYKYGICKRNIKTKNDQTMEIPTIKKSHTCRDILLRNFPGVYYTAIELLETGIYVRCISNILCLQI